MLKYTYNYIALITILRTSQIKRWTGKGPGANR